MDFDVEALDAYEAFFPRELGGAGCWKSRSKFLLFFTV